MARYGEVITTGNILSIETKMPLTMLPPKSLMITGRPVMALIKSSGFCCGMDVEIAVVLICVSNNYL